MFNIGLTPLFYRIIFLLMLTSGFSWGQEKLISVVDCESGLPITDVQVINERNEIIGQTNRLGETRISTSETDKVTFTKLGYISIIKIGLKKNNNMCLDAKWNQIDEVVVNSTKPNFYDTLIKLRDQNITDFLQFDSTITYSFTYKATSLDENTIIDSADGYFKIHYKKGYAYPIHLISNLDKYQDLQVFNYYCNPSISEDFFSKMKYIGVGALLSFYEMMGIDKMKPTWWNYRKTENEAKTKMQRNENGQKRFATYTKGDSLSKYFFFDSANVLERIEIFRPMLFYNGNYDELKCDFFASVKYSKSNPRMGEKFTHQYRFNSPDMNYKIALNVEVSAPVTRTMEIQENKQKIVDLPLSVPFHLTYLRIEEARKKGWIKFITP